MYVYKITNKIDGKVYIGQSIRPIEERFKRHLNDSLNNVLDTHLARAIRKYGKDSFYIELIDVANTQDELNKKEQFYIKEYDSVINGYNETDALYKCGGNTYKSKTTEELKEISLKISKSKIGIKNPQRRKIKVMNNITNEEFIFDTVNECKLFFNEKHHRFITNRVLGKTKTLYKGIWNIAYYENEYFQLNDELKQNRYSIEVLDKITNTKTIFPSIRNMCKHINIDRSKIKSNVAFENERYLINFK